MRDFVPPVLASSPYSAVVRDGSLIFIAGQIGQEMTGSSLKVALSARPRPVSTRWRGCSKLWVQLWLTS